MNDVGQRISEYINLKGLSNSEFADSIDLPRPILSHILSGRNKASLLVVQKIANFYEDVNMNWLLLGQGRMLESKAELNPTKVEVKPQAELKKAAPETNKKEVNTTPNKPPNEAIGNLNEALELDYIVHYYTNGTFKLFKPA